MADWNQERWRDVNWSSGLPIEDIESDVSKLNKNTAATIGIAELEEQLSQAAAVRQTTLRNLQHSLDQLTVYRQMSDTHTETELHRLDTITRIRAQLAKMRGDHVLANPDVFEEVLHQPREVIRMIDTLMEKLNELLSNLEEHSNATSEEDSVDMNAEKEALEAIFQRYQLTDLNRATGELAAECGGRESFERAFLTDFKPSCQQLTLALGDLRSPQ